MGATFIESGSESGNLTPYTTSGTVTSATDQAKTGLRSVKCDTAAGNVLAFAARAGCLADAGRRVSAYVRFDVLPTSVAGLITLYKSDNTTQVFTINLDTGGHLVAQPVGVAAATGTTVLAVNTWYRVSLAYYITNTTTYAFKVYLNGTIEVTANAGTLTNTASDTMQLRKGTAWGANKVTWYDDIYVDDGASSSSQPDVDSPCFVPYAGLPMLGVSALG